VPDHVKAKLSRWTSGTGQSVHGEKILVAFIKPSDIMRQMAAAPLTKEMLTDLKRELTPEQFERFKRPGITIHESIRMLD
jgi:hypothetical protein